MSDSENESDFASAESDQEDVEVSKESSKPQAKAENSQPIPESVTGPSPETDVQQPDKSEQISEETSTDKEAGSKDVTSENKTEQSVKVEPTSTPLESVAEQQAQTEPTAVTTEPQAQAEAITQTDLKPDKPVEPTPTPKESSGGWGWGWGSIWSSVSTVTESAQALGTKVSSVIASVEEGLGLPSPTELAQDKEEEEERRLAEAAVEHDQVERKPVLEEPHHVPESNHPEQTQDTQTQSDAGYSGFLSGLATMSKDFVSGGLDALETLGKKTMEVLSEGDPGLQKKRAMLPGQKSPTLSQLLEEAKNREEPGSDGGEGVEAPLNYSRLFEEYHGVVHLEALELLSRECATKVTGGSPGMEDEDAERLREKVEELEACFIVEEDQEALDDDSSRLPEVLELFSDFKLPLKVDKLIKVSNAWRDKVKQTTPTDENETTLKADATTPTSEEASEPQSPKDLKLVSETLYSNGLGSLAELTSASIELFKKTAELTLLPSAEKSDTIQQATKLNRLTVIVCSELDCLASVHSEAITQLDLPDTNSSVTSLYLEASNSSTYVQDAFQLLLPVLKFIQIQQLSAEVPQPNVLSRT